MTSAICPRCKAPIIIAQLPAGSFVQLDKRAKTYSLKDSIEPPVAVEPDAPETYVDHIYVCGVRK